jgi:hypothetical protein
LNYVQISRNGNQNFENEKSSLKEKMTELEEEREVKVIFYMN